MAYIKDIQIEVIPGFKDYDYYNQEIVLSTQSLPAYFLMGDEWKVKHHCICCDQIVETSRHVRSLEVDETNFFQWGHLIETQMAKNVMDGIASTFKNLKKKFENNNRFYVLNGNNREIGNVMANVFYYKCHNCKGKYLATYCLNFGEDGDGGGKVVPNYVYIEEIAYVHFNESDAKSLLSI